jgi:hypothetical protein
MSIPAFAWAIEQGREHALQSSDRLVLIYLADKANGIRVAWPSQETISDYTGLTTRTIRSSIERLVAAGLIRTEPRGKSLAYYILRPVNGEDCNPTGRRKPETISGEIPATISGEGLNAALHTGNGRPEHRKLTTEIPETISAKPLREPRREPKTREDSQSHFKDRQEDVPLSVAEIEARRRAHHEAVAAMPGPLADAINSLASAVSGVAYAPGWSAKRSREEQAEAVVTNRPRQLTPPPEQLRALRERAGIPVAPRFPQPAQQPLEAVA